MKVSGALELVIGVLTLSLVSSCVIQVPPVPPSVQVGPALGTPFGAEGTFERTLRAEGPVDLDVSTAAGEIAVRSHNSPEIRIVGRVHAYGSWPFGLSGQQKLE